MRKGSSALSVHNLNFARWMFRGAAIYGVLVLAPMYAVAAPSDRPDSYYGFIGCALVFQWLFWIIGSNPSRYRSFMLPCIAEKLVYAVPALVLVAQDSAPAIIVPFAIMDLVLGAGFFVARTRMPA
jgi:hypothetical protein